MTTMTEQDTRAGFFQQYIVHVSWELPESESFKLVASASTIFFTGFELATDYRLSLSQLSPNRGQTSATISNAV